MTPRDSDSTDDPDAPGTPTGTDAGAVTEEDADAAVDEDADASTPDPDGDADVATDPEGEDGTGVVSEGGGSGGREVVVPMRLYKTVTVVATLLAMVGVVAGFVFLDAATGQGSADGLEEIDPVTALLGLGFIVGGAATYAFSTRFRAEGMGRSKTDDDEPSDNG